MLESSEVFLKVQSRPLRLVYLVDNHDDLLDAITLYTHTWGGIGNIILPIPKDEVEAFQFKQSLNRADPDCILLPTRGIPETVAHQPLNESPALKTWISRQQITDHLEGGVPIYIDYGKLLNFGVILSKKFQIKTSDYLIYLPKVNETYKLEIGLQAGLPNERFRNFFEKQLSARLLPSPQTYIGLFKTVFLLKYGSTPLSMTVIETKGGMQFRYGGNSPEDSDHSSEKWGVDDISILWIYLDKAHSMDAAVAYWNSGIRNNKIYLPLEGFKENIPALVPLILKVLPSIRGLMIITSLDEEQATILQKDIDVAFKKANNPIYISVKYDRYKFYLIRSRFYHDYSPDFASRSVGYDKAMRFKPPVPFGHDKDDYVYGFNAEITLTSGQKLLPPKTETMALLLSNDIKSIEYAFNSSDADAINYLSRSIHANSDGIAGTVQTGKEVTLYLHPSSTVITYILKNAGYNITKNDPTRFAQGFITRLGGFEKTYELINSEALEIIKILADVYSIPKLKPGEVVDNENSEYTTKLPLKKGYGFQQIEDQLVKILSIKKKDAFNALKKWLPLLLASGLIQRGVTLICGNCGLRDWYPLQEIREFVICLGCVQEFQLGTDHLGFSYILNEMANRFVKSGGIAVLSTAALLNQINSSGYIEIGGNLHLPEKKQIVAEADLFWLTQSSLIITECKTFLYGIKNNWLDKVKDSLNQTINVAEQLGAKAVILGMVVPNDDPKIPEIHTLINDTEKIRMEKGIRVHLALNGKFYLDGRDKEEDLHRIRPLDLVLVTYLKNKKTEIGNRVPIVKGWAKSLLNQSTLLSWESELAYTYLLSNPSAKETGDHTTVTETSLDVTLKDICLEVEVLEIKQVRDYLEQYSDLLPILSSIYKRVREQFGENIKLSLELYQDPEIDHEYLTLYVKPQKYDKQMQKLVQDIRAQYEEALADCKGWLLLTIDFRSTKTTYDI